MPAMADSWPGQYNMECLASCASGAVLGVGLGGNERDNFQEGVWPQRKRVYHILERKPEKRQLHDVMVEGTFDVYYFKT
jgi:hypothetical protein